MNRLLKHVTLIIGYLLCLAVNHLQTENCFSLQVIWICIGFKLIAKHAQYLISIFSLIMHILWSFDKPSEPVLIY